MPPPSAEGLSYAATPGGTTCGASTRARQPAEPAPWRHTTSAPGTLAAYDIDRAW